MFPVSSAMCLQVILPYLEFCLDGAFTSTALHLCSMSARSSVQSTRGAEGRAAFLQLKEVNCTICQQRKLKSCHMYITFICEKPGGGI